MWCVGFRRSDGKIWRVSGSGDRRSFALGYYDALQKRIEQRAWLLLRESNPVDRSSVTLRDPAPERTYKVEIQGPDGEWMPEVSGSREYCHGYFYSVTDARPAPAVQMLDPEGEIYDERGPAKAPSPA